MPVYRFLPPPVVLLLVGLAMWLTARLLPDATLTIPGAGWLVLMITVVALLIMGLAAWALRRHRTTINPMRPEESSSLVDNGVFRWSRNPIYLADALLLIAWALYLGNLVAVLLIPLFVTLIQWFQILPEERALEQRFGDAFHEYRRSVRRWM